MHLKLVYHTLKNSVDNRYLFKLLGDRQTRYLFSYLFDTNTNKQTNKQTNEHLLVPVNNLDSSPKISKLVKLALYIFSSKPISTNWTIIVPTISTALYAVTHQ